MVPRVVLASLLQVDFFTNATKQHNLRQRYVEAEWHQLRQM